MNRPTRFLLAGLGLLALPACSLFSLSEEETTQLRQHRAGATRYFNERQYEKAIDQARRGLRLQPDQYDLLGTLAWSHLQLSMRPIPSNEVHLKKAETAFEELLSHRSLEDHDPKHVFGYGIALHNWGRIEETRGKQRRREPSAEPDKDKKLFKLARADEHDRKMLHKDTLAKRYFRNVVDGDFCRIKANKRDAYKYLMAIEYRYRNYKEAIRHGDAALRLNSEEAKYWSEQYEKTPHVEREKISRIEIANLKEDELKVRAYLARYHREQAQQPKNAHAKADYAAAITHLDVILAARPNSAEDYYFRGDCYRATGAHGKAKQDFQLFLRLGNLPSEHKAVRDAQDYLYGRGK